MPVDPFAALTALVRAEAARTRPATDPGAAPDTPDQAPSADAPDTDRRTEDGTPGR
ncbi:hypothetical protein [Streptomyces sp. NPDC047928]|uniref:hypothetical protein n=1 Tax=unclassified Streptomyces TaxID=2593676 RepID=UPI00372316AB